jgi:putative ABC transport system ATP-binding protein
MPDAVHLRDAVFAYEPGNAVLQVDSLRIEEGKRVFLYGPSGSGKTTLLGLITGILELRHGSCQVMGTEMSKLGMTARDRQRGSEMGYIFQSFNLVPYLSVRDNIELPCRVHRRRRERIVERSLEAETERLAERLDIGAHLDRSVTRLSTGQQQRVAIARAVIGRPGLVIADEPTSSLDADRRDRFLSLLFEECEEAHTSLLFVSHDRSLSARFDAQIFMGEINRIQQPELVRE